MGLKAVDSGDNVESAGVSAKCCAPRVDCCCPRNILYFVFTDCVTITNGACEDWVFGGATPL